MFKNEVKMKRTAQLRNVISLLVSIEKAINRPAHLPGMVCFYGPSGMGKSVAAAFSSEVYNAYYIELKSTWTVKYFLEILAIEMTLFEEGKPIRETIPRLFTMISKQLKNSRRPLIIDEADYLIDRKKIDIVRDLYEASEVPVILIGEQNLPKNLKESERTHGRILEFVPAERADIEDAKALRELYCKKVKISDDLLEYVTDLTKGSVRRICVNLERIQQEALVNGWLEVSLNEWGSREIYTGHAPIGGTYE